MSSLIESLPEKFFKLRVPLLGLVAAITIFFALQLPALRIYTDFEGLLPQKIAFI